MTVKKPNIPSVNNSEFWVLLVKSMFQCLTHYIPLCHRSPNACQMLLKHLDKHNNYSYCWYWKTCFLQKANSSLFMHQSQSTVLMLLMLLVCANPFWTTVPQRKNLTLVPIYGVCVCVFGDTSNRNLTNGAPYFATDKHMFSYLRTVKCY